MKKQILTKDEDVVTNKEFDFLSELADPKRKAAVKARKVERHRKKLGLTAPEKEPEKEPEEEPASADA